MATSSSQIDSNRKHARDSCISQIPEEYKMLGISQKVWELSHSGDCGAQQILIDSYNKIIEKYEVRNKDDEKLICDYQNKIDERKKKIEESRQEIVNIYERIQRGLYVSKP